MAKYIALMRGQIPASVTPVKRPEMTGTRRVMRMIEAGEVFDFNGKPGKWMEPYKPEADDEGNERGRRTKSTTNAAASSQTDPDGSQAPQGQGKPGANALP